MSVITRSPPLKSTSSGAHVAHSLAQYVIDLRPEHLSRHTIDIALCCVLDLLCAAAAALDNPGVKAARKASVALYGAGEADIWFSGATGSTCAALLANSTAAAALDLDDGYRRARGHPGAAVLPAALAAFEVLITPTRRPDGTTRHHSAAEFITAIVAGYEVGVRMSIGRLSYAPSGAWSPYAVIAAVGRLHGASVELMAQAFGIAAQTAPALPALAGLAGSDVKEGIPAGVVAGYSAYRLAEAGFTGPTGVLDDAAIFAGERILDGLGDMPLIEGTYFKPFGCCRHIHGALDAFFYLQQQHAFAREDISSIAVHTYRATFNLANRSRPVDLIDAQYSVPHCLAIGAWHGNDALLPLKLAHLDDIAVNDLAQRIAVHHDASIDPLFPVRSPSWVAVTLKDGRQLISPLTDPRGDPANPLSWGQLTEKFMIATSHTLSQVQQAAVIAAVDDLRHGDTAPLRHALKQRAAVCVADVCA